MEAKNSGLMQKVADVFGLVVCPYTLTCMYSTYEPAMCHYFPEEFASCKSCVCSTQTDRAAHGVSWARLSTSIVRYSVTTLNSSTLHFDSKSTTAGDYHFAGWMLSSVSLHWEYILWQIIYRGERKRNATGQSGVSVIDSRDKDGSSYIRDVIKLRYRGVCDHLHCLRGLCANSDEGERRI